MLTGLTTLFRQDVHYQKLLSALVQRAENPSAGVAVQPAAVIEAARPIVIASLLADWPGPILAIAGKPEDARHLADQVSVWTGVGHNALYFHAPDAIFYDRSPWNPETIHSRVHVLARLAALRGAKVGAGRGVLVASSVWALMAKSVSPMAFRRATRSLAIGDVVAPYDLLAQLVSSGYEPATVVEDPGTFSHRGSIIDVYAPNADLPYRIDFFGDEIDSIRAFDPATQRSADRVGSISLAPASEALPEWGKAAANALNALDLTTCNHASQQRIQEERAELIEGRPFLGCEFYMPYLYPRGSTLLDFLPKNTLVILDDVAAVEAAARALENQALGLRAELIDDGELPANALPPYLGWQELAPHIEKQSPVDLGYAGVESSGFEGVLVPAPRFGGEIAGALEDVTALCEADQRVVLMSRQAERLADLLREQQIYVTPTREVIEPPELGTVTIVDGIAAEGWLHREAQLLLLTDAELFGWTRIKKRPGVRRRRRAPESLFADLHDGDYVVHVEYGIGRYHGMTRKTIGDLEREYLEIEYASGDRLYVPIHQADRVSRYLGADDREPRIHRLGTNEWYRVRQRAEKAVRSIARELLELYAAREVAVGHAFAPDTTWQRELEASFAYEETGDQLCALSEVKVDMEKPKPMDRLICGDVGFGKTEVALRAAFKAVMDGKQVAVLVPTTVLAQQHFYTFRRRLRAFPVVVEMLSRFRHPREQEEVIRNLTLGRVDIVIGTHRILSNDVSFKDLGLLVIDEEQRFGVSHKEKLKQMRHQVDVLTLTATPIPRTLYMSLSGIRDMSVIDTPPEARLPVRTYVAEYDPAQVRKAILRELDRGGQVFFLHNRVRDIELVAADLRERVPEATFAVGHGQMDEDRLAQIMLGFARGESDVLICTTIIESGLDIPNVNTIIMDRADMFGLAQLYQLRGRVGRGVNRAYAYLFYKPPLTEIARKRLQTIREATELGAGFQVAMRDMEIRGAGEILGAEQHGQIAAIGFDLYLRMLQQAVKELERTPSESMATIRRAQDQTAASVIALGYGASIDLPLSAYLAQEYMPDSQLRLRFYRRLARMERMDEVDALEQELVDRFGDIPESVHNLLYLIKVRILAAHADVHAVTAKEDRLAIGLMLPLAVSVAERLCCAFPRSTTRGTRIWLPLDGDWQDRLLSLLDFLRASSPVPRDRPAS